MHALGVCHRDLKLDNIFIAYNDVVKIGDFGCSKDVSDGSLLSGVAGTKSYIAPEILKFIFYDGKKADIFSLGVILFNLISGENPFREAASSDLLFRTLISSPKSFWKFHSKTKPEGFYSDDLK